MLAISWNGVGGTGMSDFRLYNSYLSPGRVGAGRRLRRRGGDNFGRSVALSADGDRLVVGADGHNSHAELRVISGLVGKVDRLWRACL